MDHPLQCCQILIYLVDIGSQLILLKIHCNEGRILFHSLIDTTEQESMLSSHLI